MVKRNKDSIIPEKYTAEINGQIVNYVLKRSRRARYARLEFRPDTGLSVIIPRMYSRSDVHGLLKQNCAWIFRHINRNRLFTVSDEVKSIKFGVKIPYLGRDLILMQSDNGHVHEQAQLIEDTLIADCSDLELNSVIEKWYKQQALRELKRRTDETCRLLNVEYNTMIIRSQKTRWGSCSIKKTLSYNWRLVMFSGDIIDYVVLHEAAHLIEMNHSVRFWKVVERYCPDYKTHRKWLRMHGQKTAHSLEI